MNDPVVRGTPRQIMAACQAVIRELDSQRAIA